MVGMGTVNHTQQQDKACGGCGQYVSILYYTYYISEWFSTTQHKIIY